MPLDESDAAFIWDMLRHAQIIVRMTQGMTKAAYVDDERTRFAIERLVEIIGEAAGDVSDTARALAPEVPWRKIIGQRHVLAHEYGAIDHERMWTVASERIPELITALERLLAHAPPTSP